MRVPLLAPDSALRRWLGAHPYTALTALVFLGLSVPFCLRRDSEFEAVYLSAARHLRQGGGLYGRGDGYLYPPFMAWAALPFTALPGRLLRPAWLLVNLVCLVLLVRLAWRLAGGGRLQGLPAAPAAGRRGEQAAALLGALGAFFYLENCLAHQQTDVVIGTLLLGGCLLLGRGRGLAAATCFGLAAAAKCTALLWAPYLVWRRRPAAGVWLVCVAVGANFLPDFANRAPSGRPRLAEFGQLYLRPLASSHYYLGTWGSDLVYNQSLAGAGQRWLTTTWAWGTADCHVANRPHPVSPAVLRAAVLGAEGILLLAVLAVCGAPFRRVEGGAHAAVSPQALECGVVLLLMLLFSPMSSKAHFGVMVLPGFCLACAAARSGSRLLWALVLAATALGVLANKDPLGERLYTLALWHGSVTWHALLLLGGCLLVLHRQRRTRASALPCPTAGVRGQAA